MCTQLSLLDGPGGQFADLARWRVFQVTSCLLDAQLAAGWCPMDARDVSQHFPATLV